MVTVAESKKEEPPRGVPVSGRSWKKTQRSKNSMMTYKATKTLSTTWDEKMAAKSKKKEMKDLEHEIANRKKQEKVDKRVAREEKEKRRIANEFKASTLQVIKKTHKLKSMSKKQLRNIKKTRMNKNGEIELVSAKTTASKDHVLLALSDRTIQARSRATLSCERQFTAHTDTINELVISETQPWNVISGSNDGTIKVWDLRQSQPAAVQTIRVGEEVWSCSVGCGDTLVVAGAADSAVFFDLRTLRKLGQYGESHMDNVTRVQFHPVRRSEVITASDDGIVCLFDCTIADEDEATISTINVESSVSRFCMFGPDLHNIAVLTGSETLDVWNLTTAERLAHFPTIRDQCSASSAGLHTDYLVDCKYNAASDQLHLATGNHQGQLNVFQLNPQAGIVHQATLSGGHKAAIRCLDWQADMLLTGGEDARVSAVLVAVVQAAHTSTSILVGAKASATGAPLTAHSLDCSDCDFRLVKVPAMQYTESTSSDLTRNVFLTSSQYPRHVGNDRGSAYSVDNLKQPGEFFNWTDSPAIAQIPQIRETYAYLDGVVGIVNELQLSFGHSSCGAKLAARPVSQGGNAAFDIAELTRVALERTATARDAIVLMGKLAETYGFYGSSWGGDDIYSGEALTVADETEGWIFHILPDDSGASAVWAAQRVPDTDVAVVANQFVIHQVNVTDSDWYMASSNVHDVASRNGLWDETADAFDFAVVYGHLPESTVGSTRRMWRVFSLANPTLELSPVADPYAITYPFSVPVEAEVTLAAMDLIRFQRDHYENTEFDLTVGVAAGPYGTVDSETALNGRFETPIGGSTYSYVVTLDPTSAFNALLWFAPHAPSASTYIPVFVKATVVPAVIGTGSLREFDITSAYWLNSLLSNYVGRWFEHVYPVVAEARALAEYTADTAQTSVQVAVQEVKDKVGDAAAIDVLTKTTESFANDAQAATMNLLSDVITRFHDGFLVSGFENEVLEVEPMSYPEWYLDSVGYYPEAADATTEVSTDDTEEPTTTIPAAIAKVAGPIVTAGSTAAKATSTNVTTGTSSDCPDISSTKNNAWGAVVIIAFAAMLVVTTALGYVFGKRQALTRTRGDAFVIMSTLLTASVPRAYLELCSQILQERHMRDVFEERSVQLRCGWPLCRESIANRYVMLLSQASFNAFSYRVSLAKQQVYNAREEQQFCGDACLQDARKYVASLPIKPPQMLPSLTQVFGTSKPHPKDYDESRPAASSLGVPLPKHPILGPSSASRRATSAGPKVVWAKQAGMGVIERDVQIVEHVAPPRPSTDFSTANAVLIEGYVFPAHKGNRAASLKHLTGLEVCEMDQLIGVFCETMHAYVLADQLDGPAASIKAIPSATTAAAAGRTQCRKCRHRTCQCKAKAGDANRSEFSDAEIAAMMKESLKIQEMTEFGALD
ncbi:hypothetical protein DYB26_005032 [Aphanomyces astaci]|uniref:RTR1-type domain-containing protein n=1 Tax=Aphanomyces astaci TaxID=112090 RepID=A0A397D5W5_APHAT|nr:hypothetical protein DYB38_003415 [Aphanomyces astaci]RHZ40880.1 hypothetical protein DYB26_005032 [Aphanomyces astaci]